ncbi:uncharacterized protein Z518_05076 [Rhinocladiella mackenziei CBS 650.93]|uniref:Uncharacterized protein n=1 Tax=Rhinocladiella mackenziei CBS 650.93 TaxID=1442369 RepID=A0A0D2IMU5_9EURO|nr:uncharacterized protein Z518_05076 [Rhinocladiella mackenziei CBS 650.93]KIX07099.1 hypothetical protein Z518_05076 [Rhinocladiella mackenziei CBS 650.93]
MSYMQVPWRRLYLVDGEMWPLFSYALSLDMDPTRIIKRTLSNVSPKIRMETRRQTGTARHLKFKLKTYRQGRALYDNDTSTAAVPEAVNENMSSRSDPPVRTRTRHKRLDTNQAYQIPSHPGAWAAEDFGFYQSMLARHLLRFELNCVAHANDLSDQATQT